MSLKEIGVHGQFYSAILAMFRTPQSKIILNEYETEFFGCPLGLKQGACESPTLFSIYINILAEEIKTSKIGVKIESVSSEPPCANNEPEQLLLNILLYCDDIVLLADNEQDLQFLLTICENWSKKYRLEVNLGKTNVLHVRPKSRKQSPFLFCYNNKIIDYCDFYKYLGISINCHVDFQFTANALANSAGRALGIVVTKMIKNGGFGYKVYSTLVNSCVNSIADYGGEIWGYQEYDTQLKLMTRAARAFMGTSKSVPINAILAEINWPLPYHRTQQKMVSFYHHLSGIDSGRLTNKILLWDKELNLSKSIIKTWSYEVKSILEEHGFSDIYDGIGQNSIKLLKLNLKEKMLHAQQDQLKACCQTFPILEHFMTIKDFHLTPSFLTLPLKFELRSIIAKSRLDCLPIRHHTLRYARPRVPQEERYCITCQDKGSQFRFRLIETVFHVLFKCLTYKAERADWLKIITIPDNFVNFMEAEKMIQVLSLHYNIRPTAQYLRLILDKRSKILGC